MPMSVVDFCFTLRNLFRPLFFQFTLSLLQPEDLFTCKSHFPGLLAQAFIVEMHSLGDSWQL